MTEVTKYNAELKIWSGPEYISRNPTVSFGKSILDKLELHGDKIMQVRRVHEYSIRLHFVFEQINDTSGYKMTAREMRLKALKVAESLKAVGIKQGDIIQICLTEHDDLVPLWLGIIASGAVLNILHTEFLERK